MRLTTLGITVLATLLLASSAQADTTIYLVRHAEKNAGGADPELNAAGRARAEALARTMRSIKLDAVISSEWKRTQRTAEPTAKVAKVKITTRDAGKEKMLALEIGKQFKNKTILVVGHSNTVPDLMRYLGIKKAEAPELSENEYDNLFQVRISKSGVATLTRLHYGAADPVKK